MSPFKAAVALFVVFLSPPVTYASARGFIADFPPPTRYAIRLSSLRPVLGLAVWFRMKRGMLREGGTW